MRLRAALVAVLVALWASTAQAAIVQVATTASGQATDNVTTAAIDTSGANLLVLWVADHPSGGGCTIQDSKSNTWTALTVQSQAGIRGRFYYATNSPTVGSGHTGSCMGSVVVATVKFMAFSGAHQTAPFDVENGTTTTGVSHQAGSVTPSQDDSLIIAGLGFNSDAGTVTINGGFSTPSTTAYAGGVANGGSSSLLIQSGSPAAANPTWSTANVADTAVAIAVFKPSVGGGGGGSVPTQLLLGCCHP